MTKTQGKKPNDRTKPERDAFRNTQNAGVNYLIAQSLGDTSELSQQAEAFKQYAINQGIDPETDLNGLPRHVGLYAEIVPDTQEREKTELIKTVTENLGVLIPQLSGDILLRTAVQLGRTDAERGLGKVLTESPNETTEVKTAFGKLYDPSSLIQSYITLNDNPTEIAQCATGALERSYERRAAEFRYTKKRNVIINTRNLKAYILKQIEKVEQEDVDEAMVHIGASMAMKKVQDKQE